MRIGIIGAGNIGGTLARLWARAGHRVMVSSRHPDGLSGLVQQIGENARAGTARDAARFGEVVFLAIPFGAIDTTVESISGELAGKTVLDAMNPFPGRDGEVAVRAREKGPSGLTTADRLSESRVARAFSSVNYRDLASQSGRSGSPVAVPLAADDPQAREVAVRLIRDAGFEAYDLGGLADSRPLDPEGLLFGKALSREEIEASLGRG